MKVVMIHADRPWEWNCSQWRIIEPAQALMRVGVEVAVIPVTAFANLNNRETRHLIGMADLIHFQRNVVEAKDALDYWIGAGRAVTIDLDDAYDRLPPSNAAHEFWTRNVHGASPPPLDQLRSILAKATALTSPSKQILEDWKPYCKETVLWPNYATGAWYEGLRKEPHDGIIIGWGGSASHYDTFWFSPAREALEEVCKQRPNVRVQICGFDDRILERMNVPAKQMIPFVPPDQWPRNVAQFDIGIAQLTEEFDQRRSWIKCLEYMLAKVPWVASVGRPYEDLAAFGKLVPDDKDTWVAALLYTIDNRPDPMPGYIHAIDLTLERRAQDLARMLRRLVDIHYLSTKTKVVNDVIFT